MTTCGHEPTVGRVCRHLLEHKQPHRVWFTGRGIEYDLVCRQCLETPDLLAACEPCRIAAADDRQIDVFGGPGVIVAARDVRFERRDFSTPRFVDVQPIIAGDRDLWLGVTSDGGVHRWDRTRDDGRKLAQIPDGIVAFDEPITTRLSRDGRLAVIANTRSERSAVVVDLETGRPTVTLPRSDYHPEVSSYSLAFLERNGRTLLVHASDWNRLDIVDARTGELLTTRGPTRYVSGNRPEHYLDYFHCELSVSPNQRYIADGGWAWHPVGVLVAWSVDRWFENVWESEDGPSRRDLQASDNWDEPMTWLDDTRLATWSGTDDIFPASLAVFDVTTGDRVQCWFAGRGGDLVFDRVLATFDSTGTALWDVERGARIAHEPTAVARYHPGAKLFATVPDGEIAIVRACGLDANAPWVTPRVRDVAHSIARDRSFHELPVLGDTLQLAGCTDAEILAHCAHPGEHDDRCWVIDRLLVE